MASPVQEFQIGQRVSSSGKKPFIIRLIYYQHDGQLAYAAGTGLTFFTASELTLAPKRSLYVSSERLVLGRAVTFARLMPELYRCETDAEMVARHAIERAAYDAQGDRV